MITNSSSVAGLLSQEDVLFDDGLYEVTLIKKPGSVVELNDIAASLLNITPIKANKSVIWFRTSKLTIETETDIAWTLDGEFGGNEKRVCIRNCKQAIEFIVDSETKNRKSNSLLMHNDLHEAGTDD
jgi:diacylglycerol kinase family enzyme